MYPSTQILFPNIQWGLEVSVIYLRSSRDENINTFNPSALELHYHHD